MRELCRGERMLWMGGEEVTVRGRAIGEDRGSRRRPLRGAGVVLRREAELVRDVVGAGERNKRRPLVEIQLGCAVPAVAAGQ